MASAASRLASLLNGETKAQETPNPLRPAAGHFPGKAKNVIYLHMAGSPPHLDLFDFKPELVRRNGRAVPRIVPARPAFRVHQRRPELARHAAALCPARPERGVDVGRAAAHCRPSPTSCASSSRCTPSNSITPPPNCCSSPARRSSAGLRWAHGSPMASARKARTCPASSSWSRAAPSQRRQQRLGQRLLAVGLPRRAMPQPGRSGALRLQPARHGRATCAALSLDALRDLNELQADRAGQSRKRGTRIAQYELAFRMQTAVPEVMDITREPRTRHRRVRRPAGRRQLRQQLPAGPPAGRARRALRAASRLGLGLPRHRRRRGHPRPACRSSAARWTAPSPR